MTGKENIMSNKLKTTAYLALIGLLLLPLFAYSVSDNSILTVAEASNYTQTSRYQDVIKFIKKLQQQTKWLRIETICTSAEGRAVPLLIIGQPVPSSPQELKYDKRAVIYIEANIHAGEVEGKEASLMIARDIVLKEPPPYLNQLIILMAPIFNADGNEKIDPAHRRNQLGPEKGVGVRYNGQNLDLNRDSMKLESYELKGLVKNVLQRWDPLLLVDCHTTNGSYHQEPVTYSWPLNPNGDLTIINYMRDTMLPAISQRLKEKYNTLSIPYGNFVEFRSPEKGWRTFSHLPRFLTNYLGLRNRLSILDENYAYADFKTRVLACYNFLRSILDYCSEHRDEIVKLTAEADRRAIKQGLNPNSQYTFGVEFETKPLPQKVTIQGWETEIIPRKQGWPQLKKTERKRTFVLPYFAEFVAKRSVPLPYAYLIPIYDVKIERKLIQHGLLVEKLTEPASLEVEGFRLKEIKGTSSLYQGHRLNSVKGEYFKENKEFSPGTLFITTAQPLGHLAAYLLEPESDDGLLVWNFFDRYLVSQWRQQPQVYPVYKLMHPVNIAKEKIEEKI